MRYISLSFLVKKAKISKISLFKHPIDNFAPLTMTVAHKEPEYGFATRAIHVGSQPDPATGAVIPSVCGNSSSQRGSYKLANSTAFALDYVRPSQRWKPDRRV